MKVENLESFLFDSSSGVFLINGEEPKNVTGLSFTYKNGEFGLEITESFTCMNTVNSKINFKGDDSCGT